MKSNPTPFLAPPAEWCDLSKARAVIVPFPYEGGVSYGLGAADAPQAVLDASSQVEFYDEELACEPVRIGIGTAVQPRIPSDPAKMAALAAAVTEEWVARGKFTVLVGGDHSISSGYVNTLCRHYPRLGVIQLDAHADLRDSYEGNRLSHACTMARVREMTPHTLQIGIRSMDAAEAQRAAREKLALCTMRRWRAGGFDLGAALAALPQKVFITLDVDVFDWSVIASTGTPEPGGMRWYEMLDLLQTIFETKEVVGCDVVELAYRPHDPNSPFAVAKLIYKMIGFKFAPELQRLQVAGEP